MIWSVLLIMMSKMKIVMMTFTLVMYVFVFLVRYRFMVMDRLGTDLQKVFVENAEQLKKPTVLQLGCLIVSDHQYVDSRCLGARKWKKFGVLG